MTEKNAVKKQEVKEELKSKVERVEEEFDVPEMEVDPNQSIYKDVFFLKPIVKDDAYFQISKKVGNKYLVNPKTTYRSVGGVLKKIETSSYRYQEEEKKTIKLHIVSETENGKVLYILSSAYTRPFINVVNCLLDFNKPIEKINITLTYKDKYANASVSINGVAAKWKDKSSGPGKYTKDELKDYIIPIYHPKTKALITTDKSKLEEFLEEELMKHLKVILPKSDFVNIIEEEANDVLNDEATFGEDDPDKFFELGEEN